MVKIRDKIYKKLSKVRLDSRRRRLQSSGRNAHGWVLVLGVYLMDRENKIEHLVSSLAKPKKYLLDQKWITLFGDPPTQAVNQVTIRRKFGRTPKFELINYLLSTTAWEEYDYVLICDDDIELPQQFIDDFIDAQEELDFALAQPARTHNSYIDHPITEQVDRSLARETHFVEIGPITCFRRDMLKLVAPFDETAPMGWGLDFVWPRIAEQHGLKIGIVDATPVDHSMRPPVSSYDDTKTREGMEEFLNRVHHYSRKEAYITVASYPDHRAGR